MSTIYFVQVGAARIIPYTSQQEALARVLKLREQGHKVRLRPLLDAPDQGHLI
jgi:hypothetical protein